MNNNYGVQIRKLLVSNSKETKVIKLFDGLNVVSGPTDTGKSYIYQLIRYLLGTNTNPKDIPENKDFYDAFLEMYSYSTDSVFTLKRTFSSNKVHIYNGSYDEINKDSKITTVNTKGSKNILSAKMLEYCGIDSDVNIKTHIRKNSFRKIALRDFLLFSLVSEEEIISEKSVLRTGQHISKTVELNLFYYFISGKFTSFLTLLSDKKSKKKGTKTKSENQSNDNLIMQLYDETKNEIDKLEQATEPEDISYKDDLLFVTSEIEKESKQLKDIYDNIQKLKSKKLFNIELLKRFNLLSDQFNSDLKRLEFILEGGEILSRLNTENCPTCGKRLDECSIEHKNSKEVVDSPKSEMLYKSYSSEKKKILLNVNDLSKTMDNLKMDNENLEKRIGIVEYEYQQIKEKIDKELRPTQDSLKEKIKKEVESKLVRAKIDYLKSKLIKFETQKPLLIEQESESIKNQTEKITKLINENVSELSNTMNNYLIKMHFPDIKKDKCNVEFNFETNDFTINGKHRSVFGKGYRSILYSVFLISLMKFSKEKSLPHVGFVIIDSPLTTFQESEDNSSEEKVSDELKTRFIDTFASEKDIQILILENKFPLKNTNFNFIEFTGDEKTGRYGFM
jgi:hypothetical protein